MSHEDKRAEEIWNSLVEAAKEEEQERRARARNMSRDERRDLLQAFLCGDVSRWSMANILEENNHAVLIETLLNHDLPLPRWTDEQVQTASKALKYRLHAWIGVKKPKRSVNVALVDSWVLADWVRRGELGQRLGTPRVLWWITDAVMHWVNLPTTKEVCPQLFAALKSAGFVMVETKAYEKLKSRADSATAFADQAIPSVVESMSATGLNEQVGPGHATGTGIERTWVMLQGDDLLWPTDAFSETRILNVSQSTWEALL